MAGRRLTGLLVLALLAVLLPVVRSGAGTPPRSAVTTIRVDHWDERGFSEPVEVEDVALVGAARSGLSVRARSSGSWSAWQPLLESDGVFGPAWVGTADAVQVRRHDRGSDAVDLTAVTIAGGDGLAYVPGDAAGATAAASTSYVTRAEWDPRGECAPRSPAHSGRVRMAHIHHTVIFPRYAPEDADDVVRAICLFHRDQRGFDDIGYNFLVDRYGQVYEGRAGGAEHAVEGAHAAGFNTDSVGISVIGDFELDPVPPATLESLSRLLADRFARWGIDPDTAVDVTSTSDGVLSRFPSGTTVRLPTIVGHRDTGAGTLCPGEHLYARIASVRARVADLLAAGAPTIVEPSALEPATEPVAQPAPEPLIPDLPVTGAGLGALALLPLTCARRLRRFRRR